MTEPIQHKLKLFEYLKKKQKDNEWYPLSELVNLQTTEISVAVKKLGQKTSSRK